MQYLMRKIIVLTAFLLYATHASAANYTFSPSIKINDDIGTSDQVTQSQRSITAKGNSVYMVWVDYRNGMDIYFAKSDDGGKTFGPNMPVNSEPLGGKPRVVPAIAVDDLGNIYVAWITDWGERGDVYFARSINGGISFEQEIIVNDDEPWLNIHGDWSYTYQHTPSIAVDHQGNVYVTWRDHRNGGGCGVPSGSAFSGSDIYMAKSTDGGATFASNVKVNEGCGPRLQLTSSVAVDDIGNIYVAWMDDYTPYSRIRFTHSTDGGNTFGPELLIYPGTYGQFSPSIAAVGDGEVYITWSIGGDLHFSKTTDGGYTFTGPIIIAAALSGYNPSIAVDDVTKNILVSWEYNGNVYTSISSDMGATFETMGQVNDIAYTAGGASIAAVGRNVYLVWTDYRDGNADIYFTKTSINSPPIANAGPDRVIECACPSGASVTLDASASSDADGDTLTYTWAWDGGSAEGVNPTVTLPLGTTVVTLTISDGKSIATDTVNVTVQDTTPPVTTATGGSENWYNANVISTFSATDSCSGVKEIHYSVNGTETVIPGSSASAIITTEGANNITYFAVDNAGNMESPKGFTVKIDKTPPTGSVVINGDALSTTSTSVTLTLSATDNLSGISQMRFSNDNTNWSAWEPYNTSKNWILSNTSDLMTVYVQFMDVAGNISSSYSDTIYMDTDNDGIYDSVDNCRNVYNPLQEDRNGNGIGDACDGDFDGDTIVDVRDNCPATYNPDQLDSDGDGAGELCINDPQNNCLNNSSFVSSDITQPVTVSNFADTASVTIEPGDISTDTAITVTGETSYSNFAWGSNQQVLGAIYTFTADPSSNFTSPVTITLKYDQGTMPEGGMTEQNLDLFYYDTTTLTWVPQNAIQDIVNNSLALDISHFSTYAVITTENPISDLAAVFKEVKIENSGIWASLFEKIGYAHDYYEQGDISTTKETLNAFINELKALSGKKLDSTSADMLIQFAEEIMARL